MTKLILGFLLLAFILLGSADFVEAECSWVLWSNYGTVDPAMPLALSTVKGAPSNWQPVKAFDAAQACDAAMEQADKREWEVRFKRNENKAKGEPWDAYVFRCLPDTVDPRGPKVGGR